jgi:putative ABC transport system ATP-binding protein
VLLAEGLTYRYPGAAEPLAFPNLQASQGSRVLLRGASGSGKSTLLALLAGLLTAQSGRLHVGSADLRQLTARQADGWRGRELGFVPQRLHLSPGLNVLHNLSLPYIAAGQAVDHARVQDLLDRLGLQGCAQRRPHELSLGQAQRVALARAVLRRPRVVLADEPTAHLDDGATAAVLKLLAELASVEQATLVVATHDARVAEVLLQAHTWQLLTPSVTEALR